MQLSQEFNDQDVVRPSYRIERSSDGGMPCCHLYMQTFGRATPSTPVWHSLPEQSWPRIATIRTDRVIFSPVHCNPHAQRYLRPKHGRFQKLAYVDNLGQALPSDVKAARAQIDERLPWKLFSPAEQGYGLAKELDEVWRVLLRAVHGTTLVVTASGNSHLNGDEVVVSEFDLDEMRRAMNRIDRRKRDGVRAAKSAAVFHSLLAKVDPEHFIRQAATTSGPALIIKSRGHRPTTLQREAAKESLTAVRTNLGTLAADSPRVLLELRAEIELVTLEGMVARFEALLGRDLPERRWQSFFQDNSFVLSLVFARPVQVLQTQFHAQGSSLDGTGAQVGDFLLREFGQGLAIVEIKKPGTELVRARPYRNTQVYAPSEELSGAVTQTLFQQSELRSRWLAHRDQPKLSDSMPDSVKCVVVVGMAPTGKAQKRSFEVFRSACRDVEILTFDELLEKLHSIRRQLSPTPGKASSEVPF